MTSLPGPAPSAVDQAVIEVKTSFFFLAFILYLCKPRVAINGQESLQNWGTVAFPVPPGRHILTSAQALSNATASASPPRRHRAHRI